MLLWLVLSFRIPETGTGAYRLGGVIGAYAGSLLVAALLLWFVEKITGERRPNRVWSPLLFVLAAVIGLMVTLSRIGGTVGETAG